MKKVELLSPAGDMESLYLAIHNGADAVYVGGIMYGARSYATNFTKENLVKAIKYCHLYGVKIYVTVNTIIFDDEINDFIDYIRFLYENNVDAVIMQDIGMIWKVRILFPGLEIHASTQCHNHNQEGTDLLFKLGVQRIVYAREMSLDQINKISTPLEKEVFVHGALCVCYSGCCLFSYINSKRSGNRGECVASCRLPFTLLENDKTVKANGDYALSTKELCTISNIDKLIKSGIDSLKIEGRMKSPQYVGLITKMYRKAIDSYYNNEPFKLTNMELKSMLSLYNRGYTNGYLFGEYGNDLMNIKTSNHQGIAIGNVLEINKGKIKIKLTDRLNQEDGIRFVNENKGMIANKIYNNRGLLINKASPGDIVFLDNKIDLTKLGEVCKTIDKKLIDEVNNVTLRKINIDALFIAKKNEEVTLTLLDGPNKVTVKKNKVEEAKNRPTTKDQIEKQLNKMGGTPFELKNININIDEDIFLFNGEINALRREAVQELIKVRENISFKKNFKISQIPTRKIPKEKCNINVLVRNEEQLKACLDNKIDNIYITDFNLYTKYKDSNIYYVLPRVIDKYKKYSEENLMARELGNVGVYSQNNNVVCDYTLNVANKYSFELLKDLGLNRICLSLESHILDNYDNICNAEVLIYGRVELMITKYCPVNMIILKGNKKCGLCKVNKYALKDGKGRIYPMLHQNCLTSIYDSKEINLLDKIPMLKKHINNFRIDLFDEGYDTVTNIIRKVKAYYEL